MIDKILAGVIVLLLVVIGIGIPYSYIKGETAGKASEQLKVSEAGVKEEAKTVETVLVEDKRVGALQAQLKQKDNKVADLQRKIDEFSKKPDTCEHLGTEFMGLFNDGISLQTSNSLSGVPDKNPVMLTP